MISVLIRAAQTTDAEAIRAIYNHAVHTSTATMDTEPRTPEEQMQWLTEHNGTVYPALVAQENAEGRIVGFASLSPYNRKPGYRTTAEVTVYVHEDWQRLGVGRMLLNELIEDAIKRGFVTLVALITSENHASRRLHSRFKFTEVGTLHKVGRKFNRWIDVTTMQRILDEDA
jgi:L-amino acid N-acyltransferase